MLIFANSPKYQNAESYKIQSDFIKTWSNIKWVVHSAVTAKVEHRREYILTQGTQAKWRLLSVFEEN